MRQILATLCVMASALCAYAQKPLEDNPEIKVGKLENGLTYYLMHNEKPKGCADFYIAHNVGALQEEDNQNGLAHFLEHMAFNGTKNYPGKGLLEFLAMEGVRFGYNVNAYTSRTETVYNISDVPLVRESFVDSVLFILHDWSCAITCDQDALDAERGVISEEWRRKDEPRALMAELQNNLIYKGAKHTKRNVLGTLDIINEFERQDIMDFYHKWYRPDLQAIVVVGDIDVEDFERRIDNIFSSIPTQEHPAQKDEYNIPELKTPLYENILHPMVKFNSIKVIHKQKYPEREERAYLSYFKDMALRQVATEILKERYNRVIQNDESPVKHIALVTSKLSDDFYTSMFTISPKSESQMEEALALYAKELKRALVHGFTEDELQAAKFQVSKRINSNPEEIVKNRDWVKSCLEHFLRAEALISPAEKKELQKMMIDEANAEDVYGYLRSMFADSEKIYSYTIEQDKTHLLPTPERTQEIIAMAEAQSVEAVYPEFKKINLDVDIPQTVSDFPLQCRFGNGAEVKRFKSEPVKSSNHLVIKAIFNTGFKALPQDKIESARIAAAYIDRNFGFRNYTRKDLRDNPQTGNVSMTLEIGRDECVITVQSSKEEALKACQMLYLTITEPYFDSEKNLARFKATQMKSLEKDRSERSVFDQAGRDVRYANHPWRQELKKEHYEAIDMELVKDVFNRSFGNFDGLTVYVCDDLDDDVAYEAICNMTASLKNTASGTMTAGLGGECPLYKGDCSNVKETALKAVPKSEVKISFKNQFKLKNEDFVVFDIIDYIMNSRCTNKIREERGGTYSVTYSTEFFYDNKVAESSIAFQTRPEMTEILVADAHELMADMASAGPSEDEFEHARKYLTKRHYEQTSKIKNNLSRKMSAFIMYEKHGIDKSTDYIKILERTTRKDVKKAAKKLISGDSLLSIYTEK